MTITELSTSRARTDVTELWYTRCPVPTASSLAITQDWLDEEFAPDCITVSSLRASTDRSVRESHFDHTKDDSFRQGGSIPPIWARSRGNDLKLIGLSWVEQYQRILALPGSGQLSPADLRGKRLAVPRRLNDQIDFWRATALRGYEETLKLVGLTLADVELVDLPVDEPFIRAETESHSGPLFSAWQLRRLQRAEIFALIRGEVDAIYASGGRGAEFEAFLDATVVFDIAGAPNLATRVNNITPAALTVSGALLEERPDLVARYVASTLRAAEWAKEHAVETRRIIAAEVGIAEEWVEDAYPDSIHLGLTPSLDRDLVDALESQKQFLLRWGFIESDFDLDGWIDPRPLADAQALLAAEATSEP